MWPEKLNGPLIFHTLCVSGNYLLFLTTDQCLWSLQPSNTKDFFFSDCCRLDWSMCYYLIFLNERHNSHLLHVCCKLSTMAGTLTHYSWFLTPALWCPGYYSHLQVKILRLRELPKHILSTLHPSLGVNLNPDLTPKPVPHYIYNDFQSEMTI